MRNLYSADLRVHTLLLWMFFFLVFLVAYTIYSWAPPLLGDYGVSEYRAPLGLAIFNGSGVLGDLILIVLAGRFGIARSLMAMATVAATALIAFVVADSISHTIIFTSLLFAGAGLSSCQIGQLTITVSVYPERTCLTGVGWSAALGRLSSIIGPGVGGIFLALTISAQRIVSIAIVPLAIALLVAIILTVRGERRPPA